jgi:hypothetical protein
MVVFMVLIIPMPFTLKRKLFTFLAENPVIAKLQYGLKVTEIQRTNTFNPLLVADSRYELTDHIHLHPDTLS